MTIAVTPTAKHPFALACPACSGDQLHRDRAEVLAGAGLRIRCRCGDCGACPVLSLVGHEGRILIYWLDPDEPEHAGVRTRDRATVLRKSTVRAQLARTGGSS